MSDERITSLPVLSDLDGSEWLVADDGSTTYRTPSDIYRKDDRPVVLGAADMGVLKGSPVIVGSGGRWAAYAFDDASVERVGGVVDMPASWSSYDIDIWHSTKTGNAGNAEIKERILSPSDGTDLTTQDYDLTHVSVAAVGTADTLGVTTLRSGRTATGGGTLVTVERDGGRTDDDLTGDFLILAVVLRKAS